MIRNTRAERARREDVHMFQLTSFSPKNFNAASSCLENASDACSAERLFISIVVGGSSINELKRSTSGQTRCHLLPFYRDIGSNWLMITSLRQERLDRIITAPGSKCPPWNSGKEQHAVTKTRGGSRNPGSVQFLPASRTARTPIMQNRARTPITASRRRASSVAITCLGDSAMLCCPQPDGQGVEGARQD